ncbi:hypothetical protein [Aliidiomarina maris]|uniref:Uncharacterized protein n=1 Tax=Aliidiomarina maris TaxID=531312 RepID=A0A327WVP5_9GAMM|nr:hypothetical protein [Aliidiomarina maris]MCL5050742.1 hypothetical protein [Bacillota bacterium]RAJ97056.1 hypothetical protein B0I24_106119 [Aliidiomarina maris]
MPSFNTLVEWLQPYLVLIASISALLAIVSLVLVPILLVQMPADYFLAAHRIRRRHYTSRWLQILRNMVAVVLMLAGILMLVLPGQGLLTMMVAMILSDVPGKYRLERWFILRPGMLRAINWIRRRYHKKPMVAPPTGNNRKVFGQRRNSNFKGR